MRPIPVLYLITELAVGGAQKALYRLLSGLNRGRFSPTVACFYNGDGEVATDIRKLDIPVVDLRMQHKLDLAALVRLFRLIRSVRPVILHTSLFHANLPGRILGRLAGVPVIVSSERTLAMEGEWRYRLNRWTIGWVDRVVAVSDAVGHFCTMHIGLPPGKIVTIYNGVQVPVSREDRKAEARRELRLPGDVPVLGAVGRLDPIKGLETLLQALADLQPGCPSRLAIIGDGPQRGALESLAAEYGLSHRICWAGYRPDVPDLLPAFDLFVQPSRVEGMPNTILEAMAAGLPVIATQVGGTPEIVVNGFTGLLVPPGDPRALSREIRRLLNDPGLGRRMGLAGRERVQQYFSIEQTVRKTEALYEQLLVEKGLAK